MTAAGIPAILGTGTLIKKKTLPLFTFLPAQKVTKKGTEINVQHDFGYALIRQLCYCDFNGRNAIHLTKAGRVFNFFVRCFTEGI